MTKTEMINTFSYNGKTKESSHKEEVLNTFYRNDLENRILENHTLNELIRNRDDLKL